MKRKHSLELGIFKKQKTDALAKLQYIAKLHEEANMKPLPDEKGGLMTIGHRDSEQVDELIKEMGEFSL